MWCVICDNKGVESMRKEVIEVHVVGLEEAGAGVEGSVVCYIPSSGINQANELAPG